MTDQSCPSARIPLPLTLPLTVDLSTNGGIRPLSFRKLVGHEILWLHTQPHVVVKVESGAEIIAIAEPEKSSNVASAARVDIGGSKCRVVPSWWDQKNLDTLASEGCCSY